MMTAGDMTSLHVLCCGSWCPKRRLKLGARLRPLLPLLIRPLNISVRAPTHAQTSLLPDPQTTRRR